MSRADRDFWKEQARKARSARNENYSAVSSSPLTGSFGSKRDTKDNEDELYRQIAVKVCKYISIIMICFFCADHIMCGYFYPRFHLPVISKVCKIIWFILLFIQQLIFCKAFLRERDFLQKLLVSLAFIALTICSVPLGVVYFKSEKNVTLKNSLTVWLMEKYPDDPKKIFTIMGIWLLVFVIVFVIYLLIFRGDGLISKAQFSAFKFFGISVVISFVSIHYAIIMIPLALVASLLYVIGTVLLIGIAVATIYILVNMVPVIKLLPKLLFESFGETFKSIGYEALKANVRNSDLRQMEKDDIRDNDIIRRNREGLGKTFGDSKAQSNAINDATERIAQRENRRKKM